MSFQKYLVDNGYICFVLDTKTGRYENKVKILSSMVNLDYRYIHKNDPLLKKIKKGCSIYEDISWEDRKNEICWGLHEKNKPPTLISPRPKIKVEKIIDGYVRIFYGHYLDDYMNMCLQKQTPFEILNAIKNKTEFYYNLT